MQEAQTNPSSVKQVQQHQHIVPPPTPAPSGYFKNPREESVAQDSCSKRRKLNGTRRKEAEDEEEFDELEELAPESENKKPGGIEAREKVSTLFMAHQNPPLVEDVRPFASHQSRIILLNSFLPEKKTPHSQSHSQVNLLVFPLLFPTHLPLRKPFRESNTA